MTKRRLGAANIDENLTVRTVMAMASEMEEARRTINKACIAFATLAKSVGVRVEFDS